MSHSSSAILNSSADAAAQAFQQQKLIRHENLKWLIIAQAVVVAPLLLYLPPWLGLLWAGATYWRLQIYRGKSPFPSVITKAVLGVACVAGLMLSYGGNISVEPMVGFLAAAFVLKLLEIRTRKDSLILIFIGFVAIATQFLFAQTLFSALYAVGACVVLITSWKTIYLTKEARNIQKLRGGGILLIHAIPLMVVMFVVMPRLGPLWRVPMPEGQGATGFSDTMSPGDLSNLVKSSGTAFRATFESGLQPAPRDLYWRGLILDHFDGRTWKLNEQWDAGNNRAAPRNISLSKVMDYSIILEPHKHRWLFSLAEPLTVSSQQGIRAKVSDIGLLASRDMVVNRLQYGVASLPQHIYPWPDLTFVERRRYTNLPSSSNPEAQELAREWSLQGLSTQEKIQAALTRFNEDFYYTLQPPRLGTHSVDEFLFQSKRGFCEHFASSFVFLMRAANVPSRVIVGYQGGTFNTVENYWMISQADAHAWAEVWVDDQGWQRVDPTNAVAPNRVELGISEALPEQERTLVAEGHFDAPDWMMDLRQRWDAAGYIWHRWVLGYDGEMQTKLLKRLLGGIDPWRIGIALIIVCGIILGGFAWLTIRPQWQRRSRLEAALKHFDKSVNNLGFPRRKDESLGSFCRRMSKLDRRYEVACHQLSKLSERVLYANDSQHQRALIRALRRFPQKL